MNTRHYSPIDQLLLTVENGLRTVFGKPEITERPDPALDIPENELSDAERELAGIENPLYIYCDIVQIT